MKTNRIFSLFFALILTLSLFTPAYATGDEPQLSEDPNILAKAALLVDYTTGDIAYAKNEHEELYPASLTKIMTALVVLEMCEDPRNTTITVDNMQMYNYIIADGGVHAGLVKGETFTVYDLLVGMMLASYCDVPDLLAKHFGGGDISVFIAKMNDAFDAGEKIVTSYRNTKNFDDNWISASYGLHWQNVEGILQSLHRHS